MEYTDYDEYDFVEDEFFVRWVNHYDKESDQFWQQWTRDHPEKLETVLLARQMIQSIGYKPRYKLSESERREILERIRGNRKSMGPAISDKRRSNRLNLMRVAAAIVLLAMLLFYYQHWSNHPAMQQASVVEMSSHNPAGRKSIFQLDDGTLVKLNAESTLRYPEKFTHDHRTVYLEGEAFFEVVSDETRPFLVVTGAITTRVVGTSFYVRNHPSNGYIQVALVSGKVSVLDQTGIAIALEPNEMVSFSRGNITKGTFDRNLLFGWVDNKLVFNEADARQVVKQLEKWYGVRFTLERELMFEGLYSGVFENESLDNVLQGIRYGAEYSFTYEIIDRQVVIRHD